MATGRKGKLVDGAFAHRPFVDGIPCGFGLAGVDGESFALLEHLVDRNCVWAHHVKVVDVHATAGMGGQETVGGTRNPLDASNSCLVNVSL